MTALAMILGMVPMALGLGEAGFVPGVFLYLSFWFPSAVRARATSLFLLGIPVANIVGSPISGTGINAGTTVTAVAGTSVTIAPANLTVVVPTGTAITLNGLPVAFSSIVVGATLEVKALQVGQVVNVPILTANVGTQ